MSHGHSHDHGDPHDHDHGQGHGGHGVATTVEADTVDDDGPVSSNTERYEMEDLFRGEAPENRHFFKVAGLVVLVVLMALALAYPFLFKGK